MDQKGDRSEEAPRMKNYELILRDADEPGESILYSNIERPELDAPEDIIEVLYNSACSIAEVLGVTQAADASEN